MVLFLAVILLLPDEAPRTPAVAWFFLTVSVSALVSVAVNALLKP